MNASRLRELKFFSLLFLLPGLGGLVLSAVISTQYLQKLPRTPVPEEMRMIPREIHGTVVYQTDGENRALNMAEGISVTVALVGILLSIVYLEKHSSFQARSENKDENAPERAG
jgi:hypothetical protein